MLPTKRICIFNQIFNTCSQGVSVFTNSLTHKNLALRGIFNPTEQGKPRCAYEQTSISSAAVAAHITLIQSLGLRCNILM